MNDKDLLNLFCSNRRDWNDWRRENPSQRVSFYREDFSRFKRREVDLQSVSLAGCSFDRADFTYALLEKATLTDARIRGASFRGSNLSGAALTGADLSNSDFSNTNLENADLTGSNLFRALLNGANLTGADLRAARFEETDLTGAILHKTDLTETYFRSPMFKDSDFDRAILDNAVFVRCDLRNARSLDTIRFFGPSSIDLDTLYLSRDEITESFYRGVGITDGLLTYLKSLTVKPFEFYSCFISYSSKDQAIAERLYLDLQAKSVRCWYAPEDLKTGDKFRQRIEDSIRIHDKLLIILSKNSIGSPWVTTEVEAAIEREHRESRLVLFPIRIDDAVIKTNQAWAAALRRERHITDFTKWKDHDAYQKAFAKLLNDLKAASRK